MNFGGGYTYPQENEFQFRSPWIPAPTNTPIPLNTVWKNQFGRTNWQENLAYQNGYAQDMQNFSNNGGGIQSLNPQILRGLNGGLNNRDLGLPPVINNIGLTYPQPPNSYSFADILSTKNVASSSLNRSIHAESRHLAQNLQAQANQYQYQTNNIEMSHANHDYYQIQSFTAMLQDEFPDPYTPVYNLNSPPKTVTDATQGLAKSFYFAPVTPDQTKNSKNNRHLNLSVDESPWPERNRHDMNSNKDIVPILENEVVVHQNDELLQNIVDSSSAVNDTREIIKDNGDQEIDLNKSPVQKTPKRRKHRPKVVIEGKPKRTPKPAAAPHNPGSEQNSTVKRKYTRKNGLKPATKLEDPPAVKSCRRVLSYDLEKKIDESEGIFVNQLQEKQHGTARYFDLNLECQAIEQCNETDNMFEKRSVAQINQNKGPVEREKQEAPKLNLTHSRDHVQNNCNSQPATLIDLTTDDLNSVLNNSNTHSSGPRQIRQRSDHDPQNIYAKGPGRTFLQTKNSNAVLEKEGQLMLQRSFQNIADSNKERMLKRKHHPAMEECTHQYTATLNSLLCQEMFQANGYTRLGEGFLDTQKKIKSGSVHLTNYRNASNRVDQNLFNSKINQVAVNSNFENRNTLRKMNSGVAEKYIGDEYHVASQHDFAKRNNSPTLLSHRSNTVKAQSNGSTKVDNITSRAMIENINYLSLPCPKRLTASVIAKTTEGLTSSIVTSANVLIRENRKEKQNQPSAAVPKGPSKRQPYLISIDELISRLEGLQLNSQMANKTVEQEKNALVPYKGNGAIVSYERLIKKRKPRPKVDLDPETDRQWKLLMGKEQSETSEGTNKDKEKWWEEERKVFRGRADSFIARMHLVQGDRRFSRWKGSVVDSVIGVFLTQNVSDHLSSSAFMDLAAKFPVTVSTNDRSCYGQHKPILVEEPEVYILESNLSEKVPSSRPIYDQNHIISEQSLEHSKEILNTSEAEYLPTMEELLHENSNYGALGWQETSRVEARALPKNHYMRQQNIFHPEPSKEKNQYSCKNVRHERTTNNKIELADKVVEQNVLDKKSYLGEEGINKKISTNSNARKGKVEVQKTDWDVLRREVQSHGKRERLNDAMDSMDYEALRCADVNEIAMCILKRGMNHMLADRMKDFLNRLVREHGSMDLEWLRDAPPDQTKDYLLSIRGLGLKSVECVRLLTLHQLAFPVDTNVGRIAVRLGWVPLQPLPESLQLHLLEMYPVLESIQKYIWPRLCKLDQRTLYELHYQMITFGKVFCTKSKPNCNACPMRAECRHFASAFASARLALPGPEEKSIVNPSVPFDAGKNHTFFLNPMPLLEPGETSYSRGPCEPIIEEPATPEAESTEISESDIEDAFYEDPDKIPTIKLNIEEFTQNLQNYMSYEVQDGDISNAIVAMNTAAASFPTPKLKNMSRLRTEHQVYELPDSHPLLEGLEQRERDDPSPYLLAIWTPGENADSTQTPEKSYVEPDENCTREANPHTVPGTLLIPCRTAMRGSFPLNGTYFQVNEMFADHESSLVPVNVPRAWIWNLPRRTVYFGTSVSSIFRGLSTQGIQYCFWRGFVCVRGFDQKMRAPRPLQRRFHLSGSKVAKKQNNET